MQSYCHVGIVFSCVCACTLQAPAGLILTLTIPVVDHEKPNDNWNKWLNVLHCVTAPLIMMLITKGTIRCLFGCDKLTCM